MARILRPIGLMILGAGLFWSATSAWEFLAIDRCLDRGGRWEYQFDRCEFCDSE